MAEHFRGLGPLCTSRLATAVVCHRIHPARTSFHGLLGTGACCILSAEKCKACRTTTQQRCCVEPLASVRSATKFRGMWSQRARTRKRKPSSGAIQQVLLLKSRQWQFIKLCWPIGSSNLLGSSREGIREYITYWDYIPLQTTNSQNAKQSNIM